MFTTKNHVMVKSLEEAYDLIQERGSVILGGIMWLKMGNRKIENAIDLSALSLNRIEEDENSFIIGAMTTLRDMEIHEGLNRYFEGYLAKAVKGIVGVQFRNGATVGGSVASKLGFSDVITSLLALDTELEFVHAGRVPLKDYLEMKPIKDVLARIIIKKDGRKAAYETVRKSATDFPILASAVSYNNGVWSVVLGGRPGAPKRMDFEAGPQLLEQEMEEMQRKMMEEMTFGTNYLGSQEYRSMLAKVLTKRNVEKISGGYHGH
ncbi:FAD binding domain-containing protein [Proteiniclasticum sp. BAD-10]|uniref:FAD binding domain-containing protein n=1 Tax=Proteiniclasticum sediminis TaxID=2804028 RepID=A0A941HRC7_9CLOT|nr:FAD binding domain-containing protein [Proteiniclasticum sediminis]MBR0576463.1 FAD binding domain-containing protein [Proteiniclasticum sediminis]